MCFLKIQGIRYLNINRTNTPLTYTVFFLIFNLFINYNSTAQDSLVFKKLYYPSGNISSEGYMTDGVPEGYWKSYYESGKLFSEGNRKNGLLDGSWRFYSETEHLKEEINFINDRKEGYSRTFYKNGALREKIPYSSGIKSGVSETYFQNGSLKQKMPYEENLRSGRSYTYSEDDGRIIILEEYLEDKLLEQFYINRYDSEGKKSNLWIEFHPNEKKQLEGSYEDGKKNGIFKEYDEDENLIAVYNYQDGELASTNKELKFFNIERSFYSNKQLKQSVSKSLLGLRQGYTYNYDSTGILLEALFYDKDTLVFSGITDSLGRKQLLWEYYYRNGKISSTGAYINDLEDGPWKYYFEDGTLEQSGDFSRGKEDKIWKWYYSNSKDRRIENYTKGNRNGQFLEYDPYGYITAEGEYQDDFRNGKWFLSFGDQVEQGKYRDGLKQGEWQYFKYELSEEAKYFIGDFYQGLPDGTWNVYDENSNLIQTISFNKGSKDGSEKRFTASGQLKREMTYKAGELISINGIPFNIKVK